MITAALHGKLSSRLRDSEDILTSNVFSFFRYADRTHYLKPLLQLLDLTVTDAEATAAEFHFWPRYDDNTEPDCVLIVGRWYILIEAKHLSGFGEESENRKGQIEREIKGGLAEAHSLGREFVYVALTSHYNRPTYLLDHITYNGGQKLRWLNWQRIARLLLDALENPTEIPNREFAEDLYHLLEKMRLRPFLPFSRIKVSLQSPPAALFYSARSARYRGAFIGFAGTLADCKTIQVPRGGLFYQHRYFIGLPQVPCFNTVLTFGGNTHAPAA